MLRAEFPEAERLTKDTLASLLRRQRQVSNAPARPTGLDRRTVNYIHTILHRAFKGAEVQGGVGSITEQQPGQPPPTCRGAAATPPPWRRGRPPPSASSSPPRRREDDRLRALWLLLAATGMHRRGEALGLRWS